MNLTHYKIEFGFGVGLDRNQSPIDGVQREDALHLITSECVRLFGGYTLTQTTGGWRNPAGVLVQEPGYTLMATVPNPLANAEKPYVPGATSAYHLLTVHINMMAGYINGALNQEATAVTVTPVFFSMEFNQT